MWRVSHVAFRDPEQTLRTRYSGARHRDDRYRGADTACSSTDVAFASKANRRKDRIPNLVSIAVQCVLAATASEKMRAVQPHAFVVANPKNKPMPDWGRLNTRLDRLGGRGRAAGDIEDLASKLYCRRADSDFACRDWSDRGTASKHRNAEYKSG